jgi:hypothetical protein
VKTGTSGRPSSGSFGRAVVQHQIAVTMPGPGRECSSDRAGRIDPRAHTTSASSFGLILIGTLPRSISTARHRGIPIP